MFGSKEKVKLRAEILKLKEENRNQRAEIILLTEIEIGDPVLVDPDTKYCLALPHNIGTFDAVVGIVTGFEESGLFGNSKNHSDIHVKFSNGKTYKIPIYNRRRELE